MSVMIMEGSVLAITCPDALCIKDGVFHHSEVKLAQIHHTRKPNPICDMLLKSELLHLNP